MSGCRVCWRLQHDLIHGPAYLLGPKRAHLRAAVEIGDEWARLVLEPERRPWWQSWLTLWPADQQRVKARQWRQTRTCPVGQLREWPTDRGPAA